MRKLILIATIIVSVVVNIANAQEKKQEKTRVERELDNRSIITVNGVTYKYDWEEKKLANTANKEIPVDAKHHEYSELTTIDSMAPQYKKIFSPERLRELGERNNTMLVSCHADCRGDILSVTIHLKYAPDVSLEEVLAVGNLFTKKKVLKPRKGANIEEGVVESWGFPLRFSLLAGLPQKKRTRIMRESQPLHCGESIRENALME